MSCQVFHQETVYSQWISLVVILCYWNIKQIKIIALNIGVDRSAIQFAHRFSLSNKLHILQSVYMRGQIKKDAFYLNIIAWSGLTAS